MLVLSKAVSHYDHVAIGDDRYVISPVIHRTQLWDRDIFIARHGVASIIAIETPRPVKLESLWRRHRASIARPILRWLTRGLIAAPNDCLGTTIRGLESAGVYVPRHITTPGALCRHLKRRIATRSTAPCQATAAS